MISTVEVCYCSVCHPTEAPAQCSACGEEIRSGVRGGQHGFWHRESVDHLPIHGHRVTSTVAETNERFEREHVWYTDDGTPYTTAEWKISKDTDTARRKRRLAELRGEDPDYVAPLPPPEVQRHDVTADDFPPRSGIRQIHNLLVRTKGWEIRRFTAARGPYTGSTGEMLSVSDTVVLGARGPAVDGGVAIAVASWRDGSFDTAYAGRLANGRAVVEPVNSTELKRWIKEPA